MKTVTLMFGVLAMLVLAGCVSIPGTPPTGPVDIDSYNQPTANKVLLEPFTSEEAFRSAVHTSDGMYYRGGAVRGDFMMMAESSFAQAIDSAPASGKTSLDYSETNVQVEGIDEADLIKTDGEFLYTISGQSVFILKAHPGKDAEVVATIRSKDENPQSLFIDGDRLVVISSAWRTSQYRWGSPGFTYVDVYDMRDRAEPSRLETYRVDGSYVQARLKDGSAYIITHTHGWYGGIPELPIIMRGDREQAVSVSSIWRYPVPYRSPQLTSVFAFDVQQPGEMEHLSIVTEGQPTVYMSHENIFLASEQYVDENALQEEVVISLMHGQLSTDDQLLISKIERTDSDILSDDEKRMKILQIIERHLLTLSEAELEAFEKEVEQAYQKRLEDFPYFHYTVVSRISYTDGDLRVRADGKVPGSLNNQFSMDEYESVLRLATTINARWDWTTSERTESQNHIYTLDANLDVLDSVEGLAKGERIFSARFMGDRLYLVTFRQVDPFFVIDLSNPRRIEVLGELKIPGFSRYLHPYSENIILGLGQEADLQGRTQGLKISLFDVSDPERPREVESYKLEGKYSSSTAEWDHHAFLFSKERELLVLPVTQYDYETRDHFNGVLVFHVAEDDVSLVGAVNHGSGAYDYRGQIERSLYIEDELVTKSYFEVRWHTLDTLDHIKTVKLDVDDRTYPVPYVDSDVVR